MNSRRTLDVRLEVSQKTVGGDLEHAVWYEDEGKCDIGLICLGVEMQLLWQA